MKVKDLIRIAKERSYYNWENLRVKELLTPYDLDTLKYKAHIASGKIVDEYGKQIGYIDYDTRLSSFPKIGETILMHYKYVGKVKKIDFNTRQFDVEIWIDVVYKRDDPNLDADLRFPSFDAGTINNN